MITTQQADTACVEIERKIRVGLQVEEGRMPIWALALGQYLDHDFRQRGLYGTSAAILILSNASHPEPTDASHIQRMIAYLLDRERAERESAAASADDPWVSAARVAFQTQDVPRQAEVAYALSRVSASTLGREAALNAAIGVLDSSERLPQGYAVDDVEAHPDPVATALVVRARAANNRPVRPGDRLYLLDYLDNGADPHVRCLVLLVLTLHVPNAGKSRLRAAWRSIYALVRSEFETSTEKNHEYTRAGRQDYVRLPWQLYLMQCAAILFPYSRFNFANVQAKLEDVARQAANLRGFRYTLMGPYLSTRTQSCVHDLLTEVRLSALAKPLHRILGSTVARFTGRALRRTTALAISVVMIGLAIYSCVEWIRSSFSVAEIAPNLITEVILALLLWSMTVLFRRRRR